VAQQQAGGGWQAPADPAGPAPGVAFAGYGERLIAYLIDSLIISVVVLVLSVVGILLGSTVIGVAGDDSGGAAIVLGLLVFVFAFIISLAYFPFFWARSGATPGMNVFKIVVVRDADGSKLTTGAAILRLIGLWVGAWVLYIGWIWIFIDSRRRGWQDLIAGSVVVKRQP
jgi:uncharacterized RDD family membrane protein YckC